MEHIEKPSYYSVTPASVRYAPITPGARLIFGEISALCNKEGYCWASNEYFAKLYGVDPRTITRCIAQLVKMGFIHVENSKSRHRQIYLDIDKNVALHRQKSPSDIDKNVQQNNIYNKPRKNIVEASSTPSIFSIKNEQKKMEENERRDINIIALYLEYRGKQLADKIINAKQLSLFIKRHLKSAGQLMRAEYTNDQIVDAFNAVKVKYKDIDWTLETVTKELTK